MENNEDYSKYEIRPDVLNYEDLRQMVPALDGHPKLVNFLIRFLSVDKVNKAHGACCDTPGPMFTTRLLFEQFKINLRVDNEQVLDNLPDGAFITVSNHPFGALDGISLIHLVGTRRPKFKVMVNMILNKISAMRPNFIAVDAWASNDPDKRAVSVAGIRQALKQLRDGQPVGFFPAGAMSNTTLRDGLQDRPWQDSVLQIIYKAKVPVIPVFFHGGNSWWSNFLGHVCWPARSLRMPAEVFRKVGKTIHVSIGNPISVEEQAKYTDAKSLGDMLRAKTYELKSYK
ncbi:MAG: lysophospholipid acyltransferase family protein [Muribaculaceae bacterium]|nr:lysophospholipid acyltransferase family protein [Muribaculaceae bacterium]